MTGPTHTDGNAPDPMAEAMARARLKLMRGRAAAPPPASIGLQVRKLSRKVLKGRGSTLAKIRDQWPEIAGDQLARLCRPEKLTGGKSGRTLTLRVLPAAAPLVQHQGETLRQRASVAGGGDIVQIKLVQGALDTARQQTKPALPPLSAGELAELEASLSGMTDHKLKAALRRLGEAVWRAEVSKR